MSTPTLKRIARGVIIGIPAALVCYAVVTLGCFLANMPESNQSINSWERLNIAASVAIVLVGAGLCLGGLLTTIIEWVRWAFDRDGKPGSDH